MKPRRKRKETNRQSIRGERNVGGDGQSRTGGGGQIRKGVEVGERLAKTSCIRRPITNHNRPKKKNIVGILGRACEKRGGSLSPKRGRKKVPQREFICKKKRRLKARQKCNQIDKQAREGSRPTGKQAEYWRQGRET